MKNLLDTTRTYKESFFLSRREKALKRLRRLYRYKLSLLNRKYTDILGTLNNFQLKICIRVRPNNIFCTLKDMDSNRILVNKSSGSYRLQTSKKKLKHNIKILLQYFFKDIEIYFKEIKNVLIEVVCGIRIRKLIIKFLKQKIKRKNIILQISEKSCFNGCRPPKKKRKKRTGLRIFK